MAELPLQLVACAAAYLVHCSNVLVSGLRDFFEDIPLLILGHLCSFLGKLSDNCSVYLVEMLVMSTLDRGPNQRDLQTAFHFSTMQ